MDLTHQILSDVIVYSKYAKYVPELKRRETWAEIIQRTELMFLKKFPELAEEIKQNLQFVYDKKILPSMRVLQFAGKPIEISPNRAFNCSLILVDSWESFSETMFLLLGGSGVGYSVQYPHIEKLDPIYSPNPKKSKRYLISDTIEGWADAVGVLIKSYLKGSNSIRFDFSSIRPRGTPLKTSGGKAPGPQPLKDCLHNLRKVLDRAIEERGQGTKLKPIECHDMQCYIADAVLAGGIRRASMISFFSLKDEEMMTCKYGYWWEQNPQRGRANNSIVLVRHKITKKKFLELWEKIKASRSGDPGIYFTNNINWLANPCQPAEATVVTPNGIRQFKDIKEGDIIWGGRDWTKIIKKWSTGVKPVYKYKTTAGYFLGTENHRIIQEGKKVEVRFAETIDINQVKQNNKEFDLLDNKTIMDGLVIGDGTVHKASNNLVLLCIGKDDQSYFDSEVSSFIKKERQGIGPYVWEVKTSIQHDELPLTYERRVPERFLKGNIIQVRSFLRGLYSANGSICGNRVTFKSTSIGLIEDVQQMLSFLGISSYYTVNKPSTINHKNGTYISKQSYDLNISTDKNKFLNLVGFIQPYKQEKLNELYIKSLDARKSVPKTSYEIIEKEYIGEMEVFDITVEHQDHTYWTGGLLVSNCAEASLREAEFCNLTTINAGLIQTQEELNDLSRAASFIGTLQAAFTDFHYLRDIWKCQTEKDALLGVSQTGIAGSRVLDLDLSEAAEVVLKENKRVSQLLGINESARTTLIKPEGCLSSDSLISTNNGILSLKEIQPENLEDTKDWYEHNYVVNTDRGQAKSFLFYRNGYKQIVKITLDSGLTLKATPNHKFRILDSEYKWIESSKLQVGNLLPYSLGEYKRNNCGMLQELYKVIFPLKKNETSTKYIKQPNLLDEDLAWLLGLYYADGSNHKKGIRISGNADELKGFDKAKRIMKEKFDLDGKIHKTEQNSDDKRVQLYFNSIQLLSFLELNKLKKQKSSKIQIPEIIRKSPAYIIDSFINGYSCGDGCDKGKTNSWCTTSKRMAEQLVVVLRAIGRDAKMREMPPTESSFGDKMRYWIQERKCRLSKEGYGPKTRRDSWFILDENGLNHMSVDKIIKIETEFCNTYDINVDEVHQYLANSYVSHNTVSLVLGTSSGIHAWFSEYYIRRITLLKVDPLYKYLKKTIPDLIEDNFLKPTTEAFLCMPIKAPEGAILADESPINLLERIKKFHSEWIVPGHRHGDNTHNVSATVYVKDNEWEEVGDWMWQNRENYNGLAVLPFDGGTHRQAPFERISKEDYEELVQYAKMIDLTSIIEEDDETNFTEQLACSGGVCTIT